MAQERTTLRSPAAIQRRPPAATTIQRSPAAVAPSTAQVLQQRLGNQGTQALLARMSPAVQAATGTAPPKSSVATEKLSPLVPAQVPKSGAIQEKEAPAPSASKVSAPGSKATPESPSSAPGSFPSTSKPAAGRPAVEAPAKATTAPGSAKAPGDGPGGKTGASKAAAPNARKAIGPAIAAVQRRATGARKHSAPGVSVASAQAAAISPQAEQKRAAATQTMANLDAAKAEEVKRNEFKTKLKKAIEDATPKPTSESEATKVMKEGAAQASGTLRGQLATERDSAAGPIKSAAGTEVPASAQPAPPVVALQPEIIGPPPAPVSAAPVVPESLPPERLDYSADRAPADQTMAENNVTNEQLQEGNDPAFGPTIKARSSAEQHEATAEAKYRQGEDKVQDQAHNAAAQALSKDLAGMQGARVQQLGKVDAQKSGTKDKNARERQRVTDTIDGIKNKTRADVEVILASMETDAGNIFEAGLKRAEQAYEDTFEEAKGGVGTWLTTWGSDWDKLIAKSLGKARSEYLHQVDVAIDEVADSIAGKLKAAKDRVAAGRKEVEDFVKGLDASVKQFGEEALQSVSADFDTMGSDIDQRQDGLISKLTEQYKASYERMSAMENKLREANKSLWQRVYDATVGLIKKIIEFKNMLLSTLAKAAAVIGDIIAHPIRFLGNLVSAVMQGVKNFRANIETHLLKGLMDWIFGALSGAGLVLPDKFDLQGIISIVLQILGLTKENIRARAVAIVGEPVVAAIEKTAEVFVVIAKEGVPGIWRLIQEQLTNLKSMVLDAIFSYVKEKVIVAGITWIIGLLNPASAFFKACKAIYDIVMFFVTRGKQIMDLVNAVIDSISAIAKGSLDAAAAMVEKALAKAIPVAIGFLASLLGIGDPSKPVREFIEKARAPVNKAIDWVINLAVKGVKGLVAKGKSAVKKLIGWAMSKSKFSDDDGKTHEIYVDASGGTPHLMIASTPQTAKAFLEFYVKSQGEPFATTKKKEIEIARKAVAAADKQVEKINKELAAGKTDEQLVPLQQELLKLNVAVGEALSEMLGTDIGKLKEKYMLEGLTGTFGSIPKPKGDDFTPDHQPQAAVLEGAAELPYFTPGGQMAKRAAGRANAGYAINLHVKRHKAGRTYFGKGAGTKAAFFGRVSKVAAATETEKQKQRKTLIGEVKKELAEDVTAMKAVVKAKENFPDIVELKLPAKEEDKMIKEIGDRIVTGESQMASQDLDSLEN